MTTGKVFISVDLDWFEKNKKILVDRAHADDPNEERKNIRPDIGGISEFTSNIEDDGITLRIGFMDLNCGYVDFELPLTDNLLLNLLEISVKRMNKMRTVLEALK